MLTTTLNELYARKPCKRGWETLLLALGEPRASDREVTIMEILDANGVSDAIWSLRVFEARESALFVAALLEHVSPVAVVGFPELEELYTKCIEVLREYAAGMTSPLEVQALTRDVTKTYLARLESRRWTDDSIYALTALRYAYLAMSDLEWLISAYSYVRAACYTSPVVTLVDGEELFRKHFSGEFLV